MFGRPIPTQKWLFKRQVALNIAKQQFSGMGFKKNKASQKQVFKASTKKILKDQIYIYIHISCAGAVFCPLSRLVVFESPGPRVLWSLGPLVLWSLGHSVLVP
jgi:hypothetical protein